ncbi:hypothetical protein [Ancrocorticia populi]|uniref:hypothetical protein n=1 Tax=Ancrocorticia populi TaxID=2175228 RepID=UPI003F96C1A0
MADSWFESVDQPTAPERSNAPRARKASDNDEVSVVASGAHNRGKVISLVFVLIVVLAVSVAYLVNAANNANEEAVESTPAGNSSDTEQAVADPESVIGVAGDCRPDPGEVSVSADDENVRGAVAKWQKAYYSRDVAALKDSIAPGSWLLDNDWDSVLDEAAPDGTTWCAVMSPLEDPEVVDVDVTVSFADGKSETYPQRVTGVEEAGHWLIKDFETREG